MKLRFQLLILLLVVSIIHIISFTYLSYTDTVDILLDDSIEDLERGVFSKTKDVNFFLSGAQDEVLFLSQSPILNKLVNSKDESDKESLKADLEKEFLSFLKNKDKYLQVRYIDEDGQETVRIDRGGGTPLIVDEGLQNKGDRYYFTDSISLKEGEIFISPLDLNIEEGVIENRGTEEEPAYVPVIRYATPIFDKAGKNRGIVITNLHADEMLSNLQKGVVGDLFLLNKEGFYLTHPDYYKQWGFMFDNDEKLQKDHPVIADKLLTSSNFFESGKLVVVENIEVNEETSWVLANIISKDIIINPVKKSATKLIWIATVLAVLITILSLYLSHTLTKPIELIAKLSRGEKGVDIKKFKKKNDEIGDMARAFSRMSASIKFLSQDEKSKKK